MKTKKPAIRSDISQQEISTKAYDLWQQQGCPDGRSQEFWFEAERQLKGNSAAPFTDQPLRRAARSSKLVTAADDIDEDELQDRLDSVGKQPGRSATSL